MIGFLKIQVCLIILSNPEEQSAIPSQLQMKYTRKLVFYITENQKNLHYRNLKKTRIGLELEQKTIIENQKAKKLSILENKN